MIDRLILVDNAHPFPVEQEEALELVRFTNSLGDVIRIEEETCKAYLSLRAALAEEGVFVDVDSAYRSREEQRDLRERFLRQYGEEYTTTYVAVPGTSEHHTGLAVDLYLVVEGREVVLNEELVLFTELWRKIHEKLPAFGFILRYPEGKEDITDTGYEPWHIRHVGTAAAKEMACRRLTLEEYLQEKEDQGYQREG